MDLKFWQKALHEAERELEAATGRTTMNAAAKKIMRQGRAEAITSRGLRLIRY